MRKRRLRHHLRLLPGGDSDVSSALVGTGLLYVVLLAVGGSLVALLDRHLPSGIGAFSGFGLASAVPCLVIALWTGLRIQRSKHIAVDEAAVDMELRRVFYGDEITRVPRRALVVPTRPRRIEGQMKDGRRVAVYFRVNSDPEDLLALGEALQPRAEAATLEELVDELATPLVAQLVPDPEGVREALGRQMLERGVVVTRTEVLGG